MPQKHTSHRRNPTFLDSRPNNMGEAEETLTYEEWEYICHFSQMRDGSFPFYKGHYELALRDGVAWAKAVRLGLFIAVEDPQILRGACRYVPTSKGKAQLAFMQALIASNRPNC